MKYVVKVNKFVRTHVINGSCGSCGELLLKILKIKSELLPYSPQVPEGKVVVLSFRFIDLESDNLCRYDYVDVYSGHVNGQRLGRFCGTFKPGALVSTGNKMLLQMVSDANTAGSGFLAVFSAAHPHERGRKNMFICVAKIAGLVVAVGK